MNKIDREIKKINSTIDDFAKSMKAKMIIKHAEGYTGWDEIGEDEKPIIIRRLIDHALRGDGQEVDVANFAMMIWHLNNK